MPQQTKIFRVFVSSTFTDMKEERRILQRDVFPKLEKYCESYGARFQAVDLRWGVNEESQLNQKTLDICLNEIARCQRISPKPNFLVLLGNKYGWQPIPSKIPLDEWAQIGKTLSDEKANFLKQWYKLDGNAIPEEYVLQPRGEAYKDYDVWSHVEDNIRVILRTAVQELNLSSTQLSKYFASATHQEIINGALNPPEGIERPEDHVLALIRNIDGLPVDKTAEGYIDLKDDVPDADCQERLDNLKEELHARLNGHYEEYPAAWINGKSVLNNPVEFGNKIYTFLENIISPQLQKVVAADEIIDEIKLHKEFKEKLTEHFCGREQTLEKISVYLNGKDRKVLSLIGDSGTGKSSVLAKAVQVCEANTMKAVIVYRFIGVTSRTTNIVNLLQSICTQISKEFNVTLESLAGEGKAKSLYEINGLTEILRKCLALGTTEKPIIIFLDALDQLSDSENAKALYWIPRDLPEHATFVVSSLTELEGGLSNTLIEHLPLLPKEDAEKILNRWLAAVHRILTPKQRGQVIDKFNQSGINIQSASPANIKKGGLPLYLKLAFEKAKHWHSYDENISLNDTVPGIINDFIDELIKEGHDKDFVEHVICYMLCGRYQGLTETEILEILAFDDDYWEKMFLPKTHFEHRQELIDFKKELENANNGQKGVMKIPIVIWSRFFLDMEPFLTERDADGVPIITFFHRQFNEVLRKRYKLDEESNEENETSNTDTN
jgi:hypothetical protein